MWVNENHKLGTGICRYKRGFSASMIKGKLKSLGCMRMKVAQTIGTIPPKCFASAYVLGIGTGRNPGCLTSKEVPFELAESHCQGR
jgi:hypothetical protein